MFNDDLFGINCYKCGIVPSFADDNTVVVARKTQAENKNALNDHMEKIKEFLESNRLCINQSKTKTQNYMVYQKRTRVEDDPEIMRIETLEGQKVISNLTHGRIFGLNLQDDLGWRSHLGTGIETINPMSQKKNRTTEIYWQTNSKERSSDFSERINCLENYLYDTSLGGACRKHI